MVVAREESLRKRSLDLLRWKVTGEERKPNPFFETDRISECIDYLRSEGYIELVGGTPVCARYEVTSSGRELIRES